MSHDAFECIQDDAGWGFYLEMVKGVSIAELAAMVGADPALGVMSPEAFNAALHRTSDVPDYARLGEYAGWAFALRAGGDGFYAHRPEPLRHLWDGHTWLIVQDTTMDPPTVDVIVDGKLDWSYFDGEVHESIRADHPLTQRMIAEIALGSVEPDPDFPDEPDEWGLHVPDIRDVYRLMGEHYGLRLPGGTLRNTDLPGVFTSPRVYASGEPNNRYQNLNLS
ncbi:hypothetical protein ACFY8O_07480 [Streptomyces argenteolus]|uniref:Immunity protein 35 of polymorphic toxin system n=1 Tax=Streptomyces argenteolus TaxID=67274 RepID=A0ABW6X329_9ACTN